MSLWFDSIPTKVDWKLSIKPKGCLAALVEVKAASECRDIEQIAFVGDFCFKSRSGSDCVWHPPASLQRRQRSCAGVAAVPLSRRTNKTWATSATSFLRCLWMNSLRVYAVWNKFKG